MESALAMPTPRTLFSSQRGNLPRPRSGLFFAVIEYVIPRRRGSRPALRFFPQPKAGHPYSLNDVTGEHAYRLPTDERVVLGFVHARNGMEWSRQCLSRGTREEIVAYRPC